MKNIRYRGSVILLQSATQEWNRHLGIAWKTLAYKRLTDAKTGEIKVLTSGQSQSWRLQSLTELLQQPRKRGGKQRSSSCLCNWRLVKPMMPLLLFEQQGMLGRNVSKAQPEPSMVKRRYRVSDAKRKKKKVEVLSKPVGSIYLVTGQMRIFGSTRRRQRARWSTQPQWRSHRSGFPEQWKWLRGRSQPDDEFPG